MIAESIIIQLKKLYAQCGLSCDSFVSEPEGQEYNAHKFILNNHEVRFRTGKITPKKVGQFVTLWKRNESGVTAPYDALDSVGLFVIWVQSDNRCGFFIFPKSLLIEKDIFSNRGIGGKRGIRIYPSWDKTLSKQAQKTQSWQLKYFLNIPLDGAIDCSFIKKLHLCD
jgi:hypothetical protein